MSAISYDEAQQKMFLRYLISDETAFVSSRTILKAEYWTDRLRSSAKFILDYADRYKAIPTVDQIEATTSIRLDHTETSDSHRDWFLTEIEQFCRHKAMEKLILDGPDMLLKGDYGKLEQRAKENMQITLQKSLGLDYFSDPTDRLNRLKDKSNMCSTGWKTVDEKLYGGFNRGELSIFAAPPGGGKSLFLQNLALNWVQMGLNVVYVSLELSEDLVSLRFDAMLTNRSTKTVFKEMDEVALQVMTMKKVNKWGKLQVVKLPEAGTNCNKLNAYLKEFQIQTGSKPDAIIVDYLDLLYPNNSSINPGDLFVKDKFTSEELRALAFEWNALCVTASQLNRSALTELDFSQAHIAGGISKINTADNVLAIFSTPHMREQREYQIQFLKTRSSSGVGHKVILDYDAESLRIIDKPDGYIPDAVSATERIKAQISQVTIQPPSATNVPASSLVNATSQKPIPSMSSAATNPGSSPAKINPAKALLGLQKNR